MLSLRPHPVVDSRLIAVLLVGLAALLAPLVALSPVAAIGLLLMALGGLWFLVLRQRLTRIFLAVLAILLSGYALFGRGFAYLGAPPIFVGEIGLLLAVAAIAVRVTHVRLNGLHLLLLAFMAWGLVRTIPYIPEYGVDALRDAVLWAYGLFALGVSFALRRSDLPRVLGWYRRLAPLVVIVGPISLVAAPLLPFLDVKPGDLGVQLAGVAAFFLLGLAGPRLDAFKANIVPWFGWLGGAALVASLNRGGLLAMATAGVAALFNRRLGRWVVPASIAVTLVLSALLVNFELYIPGRPRTLSAEQLIANISTVVQDDPQDQELEGTKEWRLAWWKVIIDDTIGGPDFWTGRGFGLNLAVADGFQLSDPGLRSPHNGHLTVLARMGVPGLVVWLSFQGAFGIALLLAAYRSRRARLPTWVALYGWIFVYWLASLINASFDVYLEGPQGGIWFWAIVGFGLYLLSVDPTRHPRPDQDGAATLEERQTPDRTAPRPAASPARP
jgi:hypothetical protein